MNELTPEITSKGFKVLSVTKEQCESWGGLGICDWCNSIPTNGKYIAVLNHYYCLPCYEAWHKRAVNYPEDRPYETMHIEDIIFRLELNS